MNEIIINEIATELNVKINQVETVLKLLEEGNTIPFIARYRKEATGGLDEEQIKSIGDVYEYQVKDRKSTRLNSSHPTTSRMPSSA